MDSIRGYNVEEYCEMARNFHGGHLAPGMVIAGYMVDLACRNIPEDTLFEVICETVSCLPDAVQLLTPCTVGNQWMKLIDVGRFALTVYDKYSGEGIRVCLDPEKMKAYPAIAEWHFKLKEKKQQDKDALLKEIKKTGTDILEMHPVTVDPQYLGKKKKTVGICPVCHETFRSNEGMLCPACSDGLLPYMTPEQVKAASL